MKVFKKIIAALLCVAAVGAFLWYVKGIGDGVRADKAGMVETADEMEEIAGTLETFFRENWDSLPFDAATDSGSVWIWNERVFSLLQPEDLRAADGKVYGHSILLVDNPSSVDTAPRYKLWQYRTERCDQWGSRYYVTIVNYMGHGDADYAIMILSPGPNKQTGAETEDFSTSIDMDDVIYLVQLNEVDGGFNTTELRLDRTRDDACWIRDILDGNLDWITWSTSTFQ